MTLGELFTEIAKAIRYKDGSTGSIPALTFPERIRAISGGGGGGGNGGSGLFTIGVTDETRVTVTTEADFYMITDTASVPPLITATSAGLLPATAEVGTIAIIKEEAT